MGLGLLRVLLAISVVIAHSSPIFNIRIVGGVLAVQSFYIISGFYMALILNEKYTSNYSFYINRILRLYPIYFTVLILSTIFFVHKIGIGTSLDNWIKYYSTMDISSKIFLIVTNLSMIGSDYVYFLGLDQFGHLFYSSNFMETDPELHDFIFVPQVWTLGLEISFYLIAPFLVRKKAKWILVIIALSTIIRHSLYSIGFDFNPWNYMFFPNALSMFLLGSLSYKIYQNYKHIDISRQVNICMMVYMFMYTMFFYDIPVDYQIKHWIYCLSVFILIPWIFIYSKKSLLDRKIGELSYIIYISHVLVMMVIDVYFHKFNAFIINNNLLGLVSVIVTILFSIMLQTYIQDKVEKIRVQIQKSRCA